MSERFGTIDFDRFHTVELPKKLAECALPDLVDLRPIAFRLDDGRAYTYDPCDLGVRISSGSDEAATVVELAHGDWCDFVWELRSSFALLYAGSLRFERGSIGQLSRWEPVLRAVLDAQPIYELDSPPPLLDSDGHNLELGRRFTLEDSDDDIGGFLDRAGFVHLRGVLRPDELEDLRAEVEAAVALAEPDDERSWWTTVDGEEVCNRVNYLNDRSALVASLSDDPRLRRIGTLGGRELQVCADRLDGHAVVIKVPGASSGLADLPWHRDCGMGGHPVKCPLLNVGIQLDRATEETGQLQMIAGSHVGCSRLPSGEEVEGLPIVALDTEPGDVTVHFGHILHCAPPPTDLAASGRRALYLSFVQPLTFKLVGPGKGYNDVLFTRNAGRVSHVSEIR